MAEISERSAVRRLHDRLGFGARAGDLEAGFDETLARLLTPGEDAGAKSTPPPALATPPQQPAEIGRDAKAGKDDKSDKSDKDDEDAKKAAKKAAKNVRADQDKKLLGWWLDRMVATELPSVERLTWFWHGHFATSSQKVRSPRLMLVQNEVFRTQALGSFTDLAHALVVDPAMIRWLDGNDNRKGSPNENLAREFMELFALGVGHYEEVDVFEAARALTGWTVRRTGTEARFVPARHDAAPKTILGKTGDFDAKSFVDLVLARPESAPFVIGRLWFRLVSPTPPTATAMRRLVAAYGDGRDIRAVLKAMATDPAFTDSAAALVKQPVEWAVGMMRALGIRPSKLDDKTRLKLVAGLRGMGQLPFRPPSVGGWPAGGSWLTTSAGVARLQVAQLLAKESDLGLVEQSDDKVEGVRGLLGVDAWSSRTRAALAGLKDPGQLTAVAACSPEYVVSG